jgi:uncharacterized protein (DUF58 family)
MRRAGGLLLGAILLAATAGVLASLALFAMAIGMLVVALAAGTSVTLAAGRLTVTRYVPQREAREDQTIPVHFQVRRLAWLPVPVRLEAQVDTDRWVQLDERGATLQLMVGRRGAWQLAPSQVRLRDTLGIFERPMLAGQAERLLILPTPDLTVRIPPRSGVRSTVEETDPDGLQPYIPGTPVGHIHWPALARGAGLQQRRLVAPPAELPLVMVDTTGASDARAVDWAARVAAGVVLRLAHSGGCRVLLPDEPIATTVTDTAATLRSMHRRLALLRPAVATWPASFRVGQAPDIHIRATDASAQACVEHAPPLPLGVLAEASKPCGHP